MEKIRSVNGLMYYGPSEGWYVAYSQHYDSDAFVRSNFRTMARELAGIAPTDPYDGPEVDTEDVRIENYGGAFGRGQWLLVRPCSRAESEARAMLERIAEYLCLDEDDWSEVEYSDALESAESFLRERYRADTIRHRPISEVAQRFVSAISETGTLDLPSRDRYPNIDDSRTRGALASALRRA